MTANQINYARQREDARHNRVSERHEHGQLEVAQRTVAAKELETEISKLRQQEEGRHNREQERINWWSTTENVAETQRHNKESENQGWANIDTQRRHTERSDTTAERQAAVAERTATTAERQLALNAIDTQSRRIQAGAAVTQANAGMQQAVNAAGSLAESIRHNQVVEGESHRANVVSEAIRRVQNRISKSQTDSTIDLNSARAQAERDRAAAAMKQADAATMKAYTDMVGTAADVASELAKSMMMYGGIS